MENLGISVLLELWAERAKITRDCARLIEHNDKLKEGLEWTAEVYQQCHDELTACLKRNNEAKDS